MDFEKYMREALDQAYESGRAGDVPVGCVVINNQGEIIGRGRNRREETNSATAHAEIEAINSACSSSGDWRLDDCTLFVTLEPCPMCAGAIINSRIKTLVFGAKDENTGSCGSVINLFEEHYGHHPAIYGGVLEQESADLLSDFFKTLR